MPTRRPRPSTLRHTFFLGTYGCTPYPVASQQALQGLVFGGVHLWIGRPLQRSFVTTGEHGLGRSVAGRVLQAHGL